MLQPVEERTELQYWSSFYGEETHPIFPSQFAIFTHCNILNQYENILELGCGNGRDSLFFQSVGYNVLGIDQVISKSLKKRANSCASIEFLDCLLYTSPSPRDRQKSRMPSSA